MFIAFGKGLYGRVDQVPGLFHVATRFFYFQFIPLVPLESVIVLEGTEGNGGPREARPVPLSGKSILFAWLRAALVCGAICLFGIGLGELFETTEPLQKGAWFVAGVSLIWITRQTYRWTHAGDERALELGVALGIPLEMMEHYLRHGSFPTDDVSAGA
jgi:hypothetical protein